MDSEHVLKAGGTGLNLTAASHVIYFDLWWYPAVEAQATGRACRIGQQRNVQVHRFITRSTFEERINDIMRSKRELAGLTVSGGEQWIGKLPRAELEQLFVLRKDWERVHGSSGAAQMPIRAVCGVAMFGPVCGYWLRTAPCIPSANGHLARLPSEP